NQFLFGNRYQLLRFEDKIGLFSGACFGRSVVRHLRFRRKFGQLAGSNSLPDGRFELAQLTNFRMLVKRLQGQRMGLALGGRSHCLFTLESGRSEKCLQAVKSALRPRVELTVWGTG